MPGSTKEFEYKRIKRNANTFLISTTVCKKFSHVNAVTMVKKEGKIEQVTVLK